MNNKLEVIGIDHGWSMMKTVTQVFVTGVKEITTTPALFGDVLEYDGKYYKIGTVRQEVKDTKVEDDSFYLLTLAAVAKELKKRGLSDAKVFLAVGLPLTRFGAERNNFIKYLTKNKRVDFRYENEASVNGNEAFPQTSMKVYLKTDDMLFSGGNGTGLSFYIKYAEESTDDNPVVIAKGIDENGKEFEEKININDIDLRNASYVEMSALEAYYDVDRGNSLSSFPQETGHMGLNERCDLISSFEKVIQDMNKLGKYDLQMFYMRNMNTYLNLERQKKA